MWLKKLFCLHHWELVEAAVRDMYPNELCRYPHYRVRVTVWMCKKCGKYHSNKLKY